MTKRVVIHEDDVGMSHGANTAFVELSALGTCSSGSVMVPCPWFPEAAAIAVANPSLDLGVHLTLTSEQMPYRWRPITAPPRSAGLTDELGYFWPDVPSARKADPAAVEAELRAQIDYALAAGIDVTHLDCHMGTAQMPEFTAILRRLGHDYRLPVLLVKDLSALQSRELCRPARPRALRRRGRRGPRRRRAGLRDRPRDPLGPQDRRRDRLSRDLRRHPRGLTFLSMHFNAPGDFETINPRDAWVRTEEYALFRTGKIADWIDEFDLELIGMRGLRDDLRAAH